MTRELKRHHRARLKKNRRFYWGRDLLTDEMTAVINTPKPCGCWICSNKRAYMGPGMQEERQLRRVKEQLGSINYIDS